MPAPRSVPPRSSQRRSSVQDDTPTRTRSTRGVPATLKTEASENVAPRQSPNKLSPTITRKTTRSASNISSQPSFTDAAPEIYASYERPFFMVFGLSREFFDGLKKHHGKLPKERKYSESAVQESPTSDEDSDSEAEDSADESEESADAAPITSHTAPRGRGRGGRGTRGGRGRGGRGRGRGRGRGGLAAAISPTRSRPSRNAAPAFPLTEEDDDPSNQTTPNGEGLAFDDDDQMTDASEPTDALGLGIDVDSDLENGSIGNAHMESMTPAGSPPSTTTPQGSPPKGLLNAILDGSYTPSLIADTEPKTSRSTTKATAKTRVPKISFTSNSASQTPQESAVMPAENFRPIDPEDDILTDEDLPGPWAEDFHPQPLDDCEDMADYLLQRKYHGMSDVNQIIAALTKFSAAQRSTENLYILAENAQNILKCWQDEYLELDARVGCMPSN